MKQIEDLNEIKRDKDPNTTDEKKKRPLIKTPLDLQRLRLEKLMKNPDKPIVIPETSKEKNFMLAVPNFVRNVMGSSAGAGSGEFHVYRHLRRKEYARQKHIQAKSTREQLDDEYHNKLEKNRLEAENKTAKKRAKRLKKKKHQKKLKIEQDNNKNQKLNKSDDDDDEDESSCSEKIVDSKNVKNDEAKGGNKEKGHEDEDDDDDNSSHSTGNNSTKQDDSTT